MEKIISEIGGVFIKNLCETFAKGKSLVEIEGKVMTEMKESATKLFSAYAACLDTAMLEDKPNRRQAGLTVVRRNDERVLQTQFGEVSYHRTYYKKADGGYVYPVDQELGIEPRQRVSESLSLSLVEAAKDMSYGKATHHLTNGDISRQTVMRRIRQGDAEVRKPEEQRAVPELHIDADEAHITLRGGGKTEVPLISVYEGIERSGSRNRCKQVFHISEYGKSPEALWEQALSEIEQRYDLTDTKIYLHGDGANWIQQGLEWFPNAIFVLDKYHKNKAIKGMTAGLGVPARKWVDEEIRRALEREDVERLHALTTAICIQLPEREEFIVKQSQYLQRFMKGISICSVDPQANNGGCTEPHVSHILAARLSSRPMAWSRETLQRLAPILAAGKVTFEARDTTEPLSQPLRRTAAKAKTAFQRGTAGLPKPDAIGTLPLSGKVTGTQKLLKRFN